ncbi:hypothetical protein Peur_018613 [Populus x canadensis]
MRRKGDGTSKHTILYWMSESEKGIDVEKEANRICDKGSTGNQENTKENKDACPNTLSKANGGSLIVCPVALLGQWKDSEDNIFYKVEWCRVFLDEAHTIKSWMTTGAQSAFALPSNCYWCLTGTPLKPVQLSCGVSPLDTLFIISLLSFKWSKLIQRPYENGDPRGLKLIKAILRPLMLRRTRDTKDKEGRPILVLPPTDFQITECEQSEAELDFYDALFRRSKVSFFLLSFTYFHLPFKLIHSSTLTSDKLARRFLETNVDHATPTQTVPTRAYMEEVMEGI